MLEMKEIEWQRHQESTLHALPFHCPSSQHTSCTHNGAAISLSHQASASLHQASSKCAAIPLLQEPSALMKLQWRCHFNFIYSSTNLVLGLKWQRNDEIFRTVKPKCHRIKSHFQRTFPIPEPRIRCHFEVLRWQR